MVGQIVKHTGTWTVTFLIQQPILSSLCFVQESIWIINFTGSPGLSAFFDVFWHNALNIPHERLVTLRPDVTEK